MATTIDGAHFEPGIDQLRADIDRTRHQLSETVSALADKADVLAQFAKRTEVVSQAVKRHPGVLRTRRRHR